MLAAATMVALGFWQIRRAHEKEALLARYAAAEGLPPIGWPTVPIATDALPLFRHATGNCLEVTGWRTRPGQNLRGEPGFLVIADCRTGAEGPGLSIALGWTKNPAAGRDWKGGLVSGIIAPDSQNRMRLAAATPAPGLQAAAPPSIDAIPNNHRFYAVQWFLFAGIALLIYGLALRRKWAGTDG